MKVLHILNSLGDAGQYFIPLFQGLTEHIEIRVVSNISPLMCRRLSSLSIKYLNLRQNGLYQLYPADKGILKALFLTPLWFFKIFHYSKKEKINLIHIHNDDLIPFIIGSLISRLQKLPIVVTIHGGPPSIARSLKPFYEMHGIIVTSPEQKTHLNTKDSPIHIIPLPVDLKRFSLPDSSSESNCQVTLVSRIDADKILPIYSLLNAAELLVNDFPDIQIIIAGNGSLFKEINQKANEINKKYPRKIILTPGFIEDTPTLMRCSKLVIGVGLVVIEAMASGVPVIVAGTLKGHRGGCFGGIVDWNNVEELRKFNFSGRNSSKMTSSAEIYRAVSIILKNKEYAVSLSTFGRRYVEREFTIESVSRKTLCAYFSAIESSSKKLPSFFLIFQIFYVLGYQIMLKLSKLKR